MVTLPEKKTILENYNLAYDRIVEFHLRDLNERGEKAFLISTRYLGFWLEHAYDAVCWAEIFPEYRDIARTHVELFLKNQRPDGRIPDIVKFGEDGFEMIYTQLQECVSFTCLCFEAWQMNKDTMNLFEIYDACSKWDEWLCKNRMTRGKGLIEMFCGYDCGHDNSGRLQGMKYRGHMCKEPSDIAPGYPVDCDVAPIIAPDLNAVFYGSRVALSKMAKELGKEDEAEQWKEKAEQVKQRVMEICFDKDDCFFYDVDKNDQKRRIKSVSITALFCEHLLDKPLADEIFEKHIKNPQEFWTDYPLPGVAISEPTWNPTPKQNCWGYYSQGLTALRTLRWMPYYGYTEEMEQMMKAWISGWCRPDNVHFGQELDPITGNSSGCSEWYSSTMLYFLSAVKYLKLV